MEDELVLIASDLIPTGYYTTRRSWMKPGDVIYVPDAVLVESLPETIPAKVEPLPVKSETKPAEPKPKKRKVRK